MTNEAQSLSSSLGRQRIDPLIKDADLTRQMQQHVYKRATSHSIGRDGHKRQEQVGI